MPKGRVHVQWYDNQAPLLRPPFTPTFIPGFHLAVSRYSIWFENSSVLQIYCAAWILTDFGMFISNPNSDDYTSTWSAICPVLKELVGGVDCHDVTGLKGSSENTDVRGQDLIAINKHQYIHRTSAPETFRAKSSALESLLSKQRQSGSSDTPALIDIVLDEQSGVVLKVVWPVGNANRNKETDAQNTVNIFFDERFDQVVEVGWFYREMTEQAHIVHDHYLGATVTMDAEGEEVREAMIQTQAPVFPPHKRDLSSGAIRLQGHGYTSTMSPAQTFHPHAVTTIHSNPYIKDTTAGCDLHVLQVLPPGIFVDPFQLEGLAPEIGQAIVFGETDLEKPVGVVEGWGSLVMVKVQPEDSSATSRWLAGNSSSKTETGSKNIQAVGAGTFSATVDIPMHMRYQPPVAKDSNATHVKVAVPWPIVAWACPVDSSEDVANLEAKKLFQIPTLPLSLFSSFVSKDGSPVDWRFLLPDPIPRHYPEAHVSVPVGRLEDLGIVRAATFVLAAAGTLMVTLALVKAVSSRRSAGSKKQD